MASTMSVQRRTGSDAGGWSGGGSDCCSTCVLSVIGILVGGPVFGIWPGGVDHVAPIGALLHFLKSLRSDI